MASSLASSLLPSASSSTLQASAVVAESSSVPSLLAKLASHRATASGTASKLLQQDPPPNSLLLIIDGVFDLLLALYRLSRALLAFGTISVPRMTYAVLHYSFTLQLTFPYLAFLFGALVTAALLWLRYSHLNRYERLREAPLEKDEGFNLHPDVATAFFDEDVGRWDDGREYVYDLQLYNSPAGQYPSQTKGEGKNGSKGKDGKDTTGKGSSKEKEKEQIRMNAAMPAFLRQASIGAPSFGLSSSSSYGYGYEYGATGRLGGMPLPRSPSAAGRGGRSGGPTSGPGGPKNSSGAGGSTFHTYLDDFLQAIRIFGFLEKPVFHELARHLQTRRLVAGDSLSLDAAPAPAPGPLHAQGGGRAGAGAGGGGERGMYADDYLPSSSTASSSAAGTPGLPPYSHYSQTPHPNPSSSSKTAAKTAAAADQGNFYIVIDGSVQVYAPLPGHQEKQRRKAAAGAARERARARGEARREARREAWEARRERERERRRVEEARVRRMEKDKERERERERTGREKLSGSNGHGAEHAENWGAGQRGSSEEEGGGAKMLEDASLYENKYTGGHADEGLDGSYFDEEPYLDEEQYFDDELDEYDFECEYDQEEEEGEEDEEDEDEELSGYQLLHEVGSGGTLSSLFTILSLFTEDVKLAHQPPGGGGAQNMAHAGSTHGPGPGAGHAHAHGHGHGQMGGFPMAGPAAHAGNRSSHSQTHRHSAQGQGQGQGQGRMRHSSSSSGGGGLATPGGSEAPPLEIPSAVASAPFAASSMLPNAHTPSSVLARGPALASASASASASPSAHAHAHNGRRAVPAGLGHGLPPLPHSPAAAQHKRASSRPHAHAQQTPRAAGLGGAGGAGAGAGGAGAYQRSPRHYYSELRPQGTGVVARATVDTTLAVIPAEAFRRLTRKFPNAAAHIVQVILTRLSRVTLHTAHRYLGLTREVMQTERRINQLARAPLPRAFYESGGMEKLRQRFISVPLQPREDSNATPARTPGRGSRNASVAAASAAAAGGASAGADKGKGDDYFRARHAESHSSTTPGAFHYSRSSASASNATSVAEDMTESPDELDSSRSSRTEMQRGTSSGASTTIGGGGAASLRSNPIFQMTSTIPERATGGKGPADAAAASASKSGAGAKAPAKPSHDPPGHTQISRRSVAPGDLFSSTGGEDPRGWRDAFAGTALQTPRPISKMSTTTTSGASISTAARAASSSTSSAAQPNGKQLPERQARSAAHHQHRARGSSFLGTVEERLTFLEDEEIGWASVGLADFDLKEEVMACIANCIGLTQAAATPGNSVQASPFISAQDSLLQRNVYTSAFSPLSMLDVAGSMLGDGESSMTGGSASASHAGAAFPPELENDVQIRFFEAGSVLIKAGEMHAGMYYVIDGFLDVLLPAEKEAAKAAAAEPASAALSAAAAAAAKAEAAARRQKHHDRKPLYTVGPGGIAGYLSTLLMTSSYVDVTARTDCYVGFLPAHSLERMLERRPIVLLTLCKRLLSLLPPLCECML